MAQQASAARRDARLAEGAADDGNQEKPQKGKGKGKGKKPQKGKGKGKGGKDKKGKGKGKGGASSKDKAQAKLDAHASKRKAPVSLAAKPKCPGMPKGGKKPPMMVGPCKVYTDCAKVAWRARVPGVHVDKAFSWKVDSPQVAWGKLVAWCYVQKA